MGALESLISWISPETACRREAWRQEYEEMKSYDAGGFGRRNARWGVYNQSAEMTDRYDRDTIRARARDLERNSDMAASIIRAYKRNVVGRGFGLQARTNDENFNNAVEKLWKTWCKAKNCDVTGQQSFNQMMRMSAVRKMVDGGILFKKCYTEGGLVPFKLQAIEVDELDISITTPMKKGNKVVGGVEYNEYNKPEGFWITQYSIDGFVIPEAQYVPAKDMIYYFDKKRPSQIREISDLASTIPRIRDTNEFITAVSVKERIAACLAVFVKKVAPTGGGYGRGAVESIGSSKTYSGKMLTPGMITELNAGDEIQVVDPKGSSDDATAHLKMQLRLMGAGQGLSYEAVSRDMSETNYSSARQASIEDELTFVEEIELLQENVMSEIYETFVISVFLSGLINIRDFWKNKQEYLYHEWVASPKKWIDPLKEANANRIALETGQKTFKQIAAEGGRDWKEQIDDMAEVFQYARQMGVQLGGELFEPKDDKK